MSKLRGCAYLAVAAIAVASLLTSAADAKQGNASALNFYQAVHSARPMSAPPQAVAVPATTLSWPEGSPDYHGSNGG